jgi:hypothetical protein
VRPNGVRVLSFLEMGPKGKGEDEMLDHMARRIDAANLRGEEDTTVDFGEAGTRHKAWTGVWLASAVIGNVLFFIFIGVRYGLTEDPNLVVMVDDYHLTLPMMLIAFVISLHATQRIVSLSRTVEPS